LTGLPWFQDDTIFEMTDVDAGSVLSVINEDVPLSEPQAQVAHQKPPSYNNSVNRADDDGAPDRDDCRAKDLPTNNDHQSGSVPSEYSHSVCEDLRQLRESSQ